MRLKSGPVAIYENPLPQLKSRQCLFPSLCELDDGALAASFVMGEAMESVDSVTHMALSFDRGASWSQPKMLFPEHQAGSVPISDCAKVSNIGAGRLMALGYAFERPNPGLPLGNPETGGLLDDYVFSAISHDGGASWRDYQKIPLGWGPHTEASAPATRLASGDIISPVTCFPPWDSSIAPVYEGHTIMSGDGGLKWREGPVCMSFGGRKITCYEQRLCQLSSGAIVVIAWNENTESGERLQNHYTVSTDGGAHFSDPAPTGIMGQAASVCALGGDRLLSLNAVRRDTDRPGIYGYLVDLSRGSFDIVSGGLLWEPEIMKRSAHMADIFAYLKFGQPSAIRLSDGSIIMTFWHEDMGQYKCFTAEIELD